MTIHGLCHYCGQIRRSRWGHGVEPVTRQTRNRAALRATGDAPRETRHGTPATSLRRRRETRGLTQSPESTRFPGHYVSQTAAEAAVSVLIPTGRPGQQRAARVSHPAATPSCGELTCAGTLISLIFQIRKRSSLASTHKQGNGNTLYLTKRYNN